MTRECFLIDDDLDDQEIFLMALQQLDGEIQCRVANDGLEGLKKLSEDLSFIPDYIFIDVNMPKMNGVQCLSGIKKLEHLKNVRLIMYSTSSDPRIVNIIKDLGADSFLVKPPGFGLLVENLSKILEK
jgi:CheY-like chemotaxis protein